MKHGGYRQDCGQLGASHCTVTTRPMCILTMDLNLSSTWLEWVLPKVPALSYQGKDWLIVLFPISYRSAVCNVSCSLLTHTSSVSTLSVWFDLADFSLEPGWFALALQSNQSMQGCADLNLPNSAYILFFTVKKVGNLSFIFKAHTCVVKMTYNAYKTAHCITALQS